MYKAGVPSGSLEQGDIIKMIPVPYLQDANEKIVLLAKGKIDPEEWRDLQATPPTPQTCDDPQDKAIFVPTSTVNILVLSQSCDLERIEAGEDGRIIVAPLIEESVDPQIAEHVQKRRAAQTAGLGEKLLAAVVAGDQNAETTFTKTKDTLVKEKDDYLAKMWLGEVEGLFPVARADVGGFVLHRSICYFANVVSLPRSWYALLKERRILRVQDHWRSVLQENLARYYGRFAYPGTRAERLAVGAVGAK